MYSAISFNVFDPCHLRLTICLKMPTLFYTKQCITNKPIDLGRFFHRPGYTFFRREQNSDKCAHFFSTEVISIRKILAGNACSVKLGLRK